MICLHFASFSSVLAGKGGGAAFATAAAGAEAVDDDLPKPPLEAGAC